MRRLWVIALIFAASAAAFAIGTGNYCSTGTTSCNVVMATTIGYRAVIGVASTSGTATAFTISSSHTSGWGPCPNTPHVTDSYNMMSVYLFCGTVTATEASEYIAVTASSSVHNFTAVAWQYALSPDQGGGTDTTTATTTFNGGTTGTTTTANETVIGFFAFVGFAGTFSPCSGCNLRSSYIGSGDAPYAYFEDYTVTSIGTQSATASSTSSNNYFAGITMTMQAPSASTPTFSPSSGTPPQTVTISCTTGSVACYNTTGSPATNGSTGCTTGTLYSSAISVTASETLYGVCGGTGYTDSGVGSATYSSAPTVKGGWSVFVP